MTTTTAVKGKKVHWTKTREGKKRWAAITKKGNQAKSKALVKAQKGYTNGTGSQEDVLISYALGHVTAWLEVYAKSHGVSRSSVAYRVGKALQDSARREVLGTPN